MIESIEDITDEDVKKVEREVACLYDGWNLCDPKLLMLVSYKVLNKKVSQTTPPLSSVPCPDAKRDTEDSSKERDSIEISKEIAQLTLDYGRFKKEQDDLSILMDSCLLEIESKMGKLRALRGTEKNTI